MNAKNSHAACSYLHLDIFWVIGLIIEQKHSVLKITEQERWYYKELTIWTNKETTDVAVNLTIT